MRAAAAAVLLAAIPSFAATITPGRCPDAAPKFTIAPSLHIVITLTETLPESSYGTPALAMQGNRIAVQRTIAPASAGEVCVADSVDLGVLPAGNYELTWTDLGFRAPRVLTDSFIIGRRVSTSEYRRPSTTIAALSPLLPGSPVRLVVDYLADGSPPVASVSGETIEVTATMSLDGHPTPALYLLDLGALAEGTYHVALNRFYLQRTQTFFAPASLTFLVQSPPPSSPCASVPLAKIPLIEVTRTAAGTAHLHFEELRRGYAPAWGPPSVVDIRSNAIDIEQPLVDTDDYTHAGALPAHDTCHAEDIDLGVLPAGTYALSWAPIAMLGGVGHVLSGGGAFDWNGSAMTCSTTPAFSTSPGVTLSLQRMTFTRTFAPTKREIKGNVITVTDFQERSPVPDTRYEPLCLASSVTVGPLAPGEYVVNWQAVPGMALTPEPVGTYRFTVPAGRARPVRH